MSKIALIEQGTLFTWTIILFLWDLVWALLLTDSSFCTGIKSPYFNIVWFTLVHYSICAGEPMIRWLQVYNFDSIPSYIDIVANKYSDSDIYRQLWIDIIVKTQDLVAAVQSNYSQQQSLILAWFPSQGQCWALLRSVHHDSHGILRVLLKSAHQHTNCSDQHTMPGQRCLLNRH